MELITIVSALIFYSFSIFFGWRSFQKNCKNTGIIDSRLQFAFRILRVNQLWVLSLFFVFGILVFVILPLSGWDTLGIGGLLFVTGSFFGLIIDVALAVLTFVIALIVYPLARRKITGNSDIVLSAPTTISSEIKHSWRKDFIVIVIVLITIITPALFLSQDLRISLFSWVIRSTGAVSLVKYQPYEHVQTSLYSYLAKQKQDPIICDNIVTPIYKSQCYKDADPNFLQNKKTCELYVKQGDAEQAGYIQRDCILNQLYEKERSALPENIIDCNAVASQYANNLQIDYITKECVGIALIQKAVIQNDSIICDSILQTQPSGNYDIVALKHAVCVGRFIGSQTWKQGCGEYQNNESFGVNYSELGHCSGTLTPPNSSTMVPYYFQ